MDFNLDLGESQPPAVEEKEKEKADLDFSLDMGEVSSEQSAVGSEDSGSLDFDLEMGSEISSGSPTAEMSMDFSVEKAEKDDTMSFDLGEGIEEGTREIREATRDDIDFESAEVGDLDIGGGDEVGTKLDLARAYIDMGDPEGARSILDEVMTEGNDSQKQEAQALLDQIA